MDNKRRVFKENPAKKANPLSALFFWYTKEIFWISNKRDITLEDVYKPLPHDESSILGDRLEKEWNRELEKRRQLEYDLNSKGKKITSKHAKPSLGRALFRFLFWQNLYLAFLNVLTYLVFFVLNPIFQGWVIEYFQTDGQEEGSRKRAILNATYLVLSKLAIIGSVHHGFCQGWLMGMRTRVACCALIYRKVLKLNKSVKDQTAVGQVVNLMSNDVSRFDMLFMFVNMVWITPFQFVLFLWVMWSSIGVIILAGVAVLLFIAIPLQSIVIFKSKSLRGKIALLTDKRIQLMNELVAGIQVIKMYAWEKPFDKIVSNTRFAEIAKISMTTHIRNFFFSSMVYTERLTIIVTLVLYVLTGHYLTAEISFVLATYFNILQFSLIYMTPSGMMGFAEAAVSVKRIQEFLLLDEISSPAPVEESKPEESSSKNKTNGVSKINEIITMKKVHSRGPVEITFNRVSANWSWGQLPPTLNELTFKVKPGSLCTLAGSVGSGKTAVLNLLLRELPVGAGSVSLRQSLDDESTVDTLKPGFHTDNPNLMVSYASQDAWLFSGTVRENILFSQPYDAARYNEVTEVCALRRDFEQLANGDLTVIGDRGASLSGGQRARINLARAVYREADLYLLDDPLSAVDPRVARHLFDRCINGYLRGKTRILVTHQLQFLKCADTILFLEYGRIKYSGTYDDIKNLDSKIMDLLGKKKETKTPDDEMKTDARQDNLDSISVNSNVSSVNSIVSDGEADATPKNADGEENTKSSMSNGALFKTYFRAGASWWLIGFYIFVLVITQMATSGTDLWLGYWTNVEDMRTKAREMKANMTSYENPTNTTESVVFDIIDESKLIPTYTAIYVYAGLLVTCSFLCILRSYLIGRINMRASLKLHNQMFANLLHATMGFFHKNPSGQILNRFSKDTGAMDELLPRNMSEAVQIFSVMIGILCVIMIVNPYMILPIIIILVLFYYARLVYVNTSQKIKGLETAAKSPIFSCVSTSLNGLTTIRSCGSQIQRKLVQDFDYFQDIHTGTWFLNVVTAVAFGVFLDLVLVIFYACIAYSFVFAHAGDVKGGNVGLALSQASILTGMVQHGFRLFIETVMQLTSVDRIIQYTNLPKEHPLHSPSPLPEHWPKTGLMKLRHVSMRYDEDGPYVLKKLNIRIEAGWKVGIVGRTGAGKSSIISALFRLTGDNLEGEIIIDGIDTGHVGLLDLRERISIIPQEPVLFSQSLRYNLDPFGQYDDALLYDALREVELHDLSLDQQVTEKGSNFSVGQRQLICLARAILRQNMILMLDEATANIDAHTDAIIQKTIRKRFAKCTVLTVAHRLNTIIDSDRIIVMDAGTIVEFGTPYELLSNPNGHFSRMVAQTGKTMAKTLEKIAEDFHMKNNELENGEPPQSTQKESYNVRL